MERPTGWQGLEDAVREVRGSTAEAVRERFEAARVRMYEIGAVDLMRAITPLLPGTTPGTTLTVIEDFDQAGGRGFPPSVTLKGPERSIDPRTIEFDTLSVYPLVFEPSRVRVVVWREERKKHKHDPDKPHTSGHMRWDNSDAFDKNSLARCILEGVKQLDLPNTDLTAVEKALGLPTTSRTSKRS